MQFEGEVEINAPREDVWSFLTDPERVSGCAPGLKSLEIVEPDKKFQVVVLVGFGAVKTTFTADVIWEEMTPIDHATLKATGRAPGSTIEASAAMDLTETNENSCLLNWSADIVVRGTIASLAARLMGSVTQKLTQEFFNCMKAEIEA